MPEAELDVAVTEPERGKTLDERLNELLSGDYIDEQDSLNTDDILEILFKEYVLIDKLNNNPSERLDILKEFLLNYEQIINYLESSANDSSNVQEFKKFLVLEKDKLLAFISSENENLEITPELVKILNQTLTVCNRVFSENSRRLHSDNEIGNDIDGFSIPKLDELYRKLYDAISQNDVKKITLYRGRVIRALKVHKKEIDEKYEEVKCLDEIYNLLSESESVSMDDIQSILAKKENLTYQYYFSDYCHNMEVFKKKFSELYIKKQVKKKSAYKNALKRELKEHGRLLDERYANEFLDKKGTLPGIVTILPNAVDISVKKVVNNINEFTEARTNRRKIKECLDTFKATGQVLSTPFIYAGKFVTSNWYALYLLYNGYTDFKNAQAEAQAQAEAEAAAIARAEEEARAKLEEEARKKAEAQAQAIEEAKKRAEAEAQARVQEAQLRAEQARLYDEARAKAQADAEARAQADAEARAQEAAEAYARALEEKAELEARHRANAPGVVIDSDVDNSSQPEVGVEPNPDTAPNPDNKIGIITEDGVEPRGIPGFDLDSDRVYFIPHMILW